MKKTPITIQELTKEIKKVLSCFVQSELTQTVAIKALEIIDSFVADAPKAASEDIFVGRGMDLDELKAMAKDDLSPPEIPPWKDDPPF